MRWSNVVAMCILMAMTSGGRSVYCAQHRELPVDVYLDKMKGGWAGQMIGVSYGAPTEFKACGKTYDAEIPAWSPDTIKNALGQDDLYVELSFLESIEKHSLDITHEQAGNAFAETEFPLWHANRQGRENVRKGIMPPDSGHPENNPHCDDIDFQIEADLFGLVNPGLPGFSSAMCDIFGRIMNYGDGLYGGMFVAAMYTEAFFESNVENVVRAGLRAIPMRSTYAAAIRDVLRWHRENPDDWRTTWKLVDDKWASKPSGRCSTGGINIDAKLNGAYVVMGLLYGDGDLARTLEVSTRCGQDSDCNPSSAAGVLCTMLGYSGIPEKYKAGIPTVADQKFAGVKYAFNDVIPTCLKVARESIRRAGGSSKTIEEKEVFLIPVRYPVAPKLEQ